MFENKDKSQLPVYTKGEELFNMITHIVGGGLAIAALVLCVIKAALNHNPMGVVSGAVYGATLIILYTMSSLYHGITNKPAKRVLRVFDHCSIFLLIAGTYTPFSLSVLGGAWGWTIFGVIWGCAAIGIVLNSISIEKFKVLSMICYIAMGWMIIIRIRELVQTLGKWGILLLVGGGVFYTVGAVLYGMGKKVKYIHSVWHIFVILGSVCHFFAILIYAM